MAVVHSSFLNDAKNYYSQKREEAKQNRHKIYDEQTKTTNDIYNAGISDNEKAYEDYYKENAVQKLINEREVAENMANLGLTNSGLNRTQQTAVQLSYANNKAALDRQKQAQVDTLARNLAAELSSIEQNRLSDIASIDQQYDALETEMANENYKSALETETANTKAYTKNTSSLVHGLTASQANKLSDYIINKEYAAAEKYLNMYGSDLGDEDLVYWFKLIPNNEDLRKIKEIPDTIKSIGTKIKNRFNFNK